jgi:hypothetical protein
MLPAVRQAILSREYNICRLDQQLSTRFTRTICERERVGPSHLRRVRALDYWTLVDDRVTTQSLKGCVQTKVLIERDLRRSNRMGIGETPLWSGTRGCLDGMLTRTLCSLDSFDRREPGRYTVGVVIRLNLFGFDGDDIPCMVRAERRSQLFPNGRDGARDRDLRS